MNRVSIIADISLLLVALVWGATFVIVQNALFLLEPFTFNGIRFTIAGLLLLTWLLLFERKQLRKLERRILLSGILIGFWLFVGYAAQTAGLIYTTSAKAGFITGLSVVLVPVFSYFLLKHKPSQHAILGIIIATAGLYLLTMTDSAPLNIGDGLVFVCAIGFALQIIYTGKYSRNYPALLLTVIQIFTVAFLSLMGAFFFEDWHVMVKSAVIYAPEVVTALIVTSVFATAFAFFIQTSVQKYTTPTRVALIFATEPVFAAITGFIWADDRLSFSAIAGCFLILSGMVFSELPANKHFLQSKHKSEVNDHGSF
ncbi:drug/metabolite transporter (DMT)-like permease [Bacillus benzoevorans]|uniref:Drug/metabolite transporter (DMT)-like permease n=1 Tax=Bacillus benzoevorans TaxID=1456 RepID=A0A7X0HPK5_9BACI|nr:drug/metabolite transporter (DMT)-like permease [Bacillus benzoevorans]